ncbi:golgi-body localization protein domain-containing protein [Gilbertella persicaria]|uniref:golgi-body localization protein domain-containing protein n=1 Tax=Gilbertella persicaria TaxID=101096 RepID=UPI002220E462|nr:golgi-body localization protein domain-containing protein [Gilbertella persicaria]KAI8059019.1 golgi-body localization protein domain-containing protein [Gilbertella persicaria]
MSANVAQCLLSNDSPDVELDWMPSNFDEQTSATDELKPNKKFAHVSITVYDPLCVIDIAHKDLIAKLIPNQKEKHVASKQDTPYKRVFKNWPHASFSLSIERPCMKIKNDTQHTGIVSWSNVTFQLDGVYVAQKNRPASVLPRYSAPLTATAKDEEHIEFQANSSTFQRVQSQTRSSWTKLFRRSWKSKDAGYSGLQRKATEWHYKASMQYTIQDTCFDIEQQSSVESKHHYQQQQQHQHLVSVDQFEMKAFARLDVSFEGDRDQQIRLAWDSDTHHINVEVETKRPVLNLWLKLQDQTSQLEFWVKHIIDPFKTIKPTKEKNSSSQNSGQLYKYLSIVKAQWVVLDAVAVIEGVDRGLKGKRNVPKGYLDNAPQEDVDVRVALSMAKLACFFSGSRVFSSKDGHKRTSLSNTSVDSDIDEEKQISMSSTNKANQVPFGTCRVSLQHLLVERLLKPGNEHHWHRNDQAKTVVMWISRINTRTEIMLCLTSQMLIILPSIVVKKTGIKYSITNHYALLVATLSTANNLKLLFGKKEKTGGPKEKRFMLPHLQFQMNRADVHISLPGGHTELYLRMDSLRTQWRDQEKTPSTAIRNITLFGVAPHQPGCWDQLLELDNICLSIEKNAAHQECKQLAMTKLYLRIPYGYELCNVVDSTATLVKAIKATHARLVKGASFLFFGPSEKKEPAVLPLMRLVFDLFTVQFEDDPFEARLRMIWKTGLVEQANRIAIQDAFEIKAQALQRQSNDKHSMDEEYLSQKEETNARVNEAWQGLQEHNSKSWKRHIHASLSKESTAYEKFQHACYRNSVIASQLDEVFEGDEKASQLASLFFVDIVDLPRYPPLFDFTIKNSTLDFKAPDFDLKDTRQFMYDVGKGQPLDKPLSTLVPFHLHWQSGETWAQIRDYPLPIFLVPSDDSSHSDSTEDSPAQAWSLSGNYVLADDMGDLEATRQIHIPMIDENHAHYAINIARTSTPLKFFSIVNIDVHNSTLSQICWSVPYQPAIQDIMRVVDTFTKPPVDPSNKVGFWDKIRLIIHTRVKISFIGGGDLAIVMKGSRDPYDVSEKGFGLAKVWRNDVVWLLGHENPEGEFMQIISGDYAFGVPDLAHGGYMAPYILAASHFTPPVNHEKIRQSSSFSSFNSSTLARNQDYDSRFVKIALKLSGGIRMGVGCHLERACRPDCEICDDDNPDISPQLRNEHKQKLLEFLPHYKVKMKTPQHVHEKDYDAYKGFRSDSIHVSISIIKLSSYEEADTDKGNITGNSMHLTPGFMEHFVSWFRLFGGAISYPLRSGSLFPKLDTRPSQKFGRHMKTMKYKIVVNPLTVGYFLKDTTIEADNVTTEELGEHVGLKGFVKNFSVDMHMQREIVNISNYKLDQKRLKANWPISEAEVQLKNVDLRAVRATYSGEANDEFTATAAASSLSAENLSSHADYVSDSSVNGLNMMEGLNYKCNNDSDSSDWVDLDDFIEMGISVPNVLPNVQVLPFAFTPCIYYLRQTNRDDMEKYKYLHKTHDCILGTAIGTREMQMELLRDRSKNIDVQIRKHQTRLHSIESKRLQHGSDEKSLEEMSDTIVEKTRILYEKRELLQRYLKELSTQAMPDVAHPKKLDHHSTIFGKDSLEQWEELLGPFKQRYIAHNPQIVWNNSVRNVLYHAMDLRDHHRALSYYMTARTIKFLRDLIEAADIKYGPNHKQFDLNDDDGGMDNSMAKELIAKLLSEQDTKFYAPNETEEEKTIGNPDIDDVDMSRSENVNNPRMQLKTVPNNYVMKTSYLIDLLNPQISLQSDCDPDNIVLVANERAQVKGLNIVDETDPDIEMEMVKHRTIVSLDNVQFFVAKKEQFDSVDLLLDNHYGAKESDHWLTWIPPEMLISYVKGSDQFQRIGDRIEATMQYDKYNPLRIKTNSNIYSQAHPFEDRCDSVQLNFPSLKLTADSAQYNAIYQVATDLLLYKEPAKKERLARLREIMMAADRASLYEVTEKIVDLQNRARQLIHARDQYSQNLALLDDKRIEEFKSIRLDLFDTMEELYLGMEAIKLMQSNRRKDYDEHKTNLKFTFCAQKIEWEMLSKGEIPLCECTLTNFTFNFISKEDHSSTNILEVDIVQVKNVSSSPVFVDVLGPYFDHHKPYDFSRHKMLRCYFVSLAPVGGIPVIQHLELNLHPMRVQMTYSFGKALAYYLFPPEKSQKPIEPTAMTPSTSAPTTTVLDPDSSLTDMTLQSVSHDKSDQSISKSSSCIIAGSNQAISAPPSLYASMPTLESTKLNTSNASMSNSREEDDTNNSPSTPSKKSRKYNLQKSNKLKTSDDLSVMKKRASSNRAFILVKIPGARHCLSYQGPKEKNIEDLRDFAFEQPTLEFRNETWSWFELASSIKKDFMKAALLHNSTALLKEKLLRRHPRENSKLIEPSLSSYNPSMHTADPNKTIDGDNHSESSRDEMEDYLDIKDNMSLHSAHSQEVELELVPPKRTHIWSKFKKSKKMDHHQKPGKAEPNLSGENLSANVFKDDSFMPEMRSVSPSPMRQDDDQLTIKGRYLLGKYYNGPTQWLVSGAKMKAKPISNKKV